MLVPALLHGREGNVILDWLVQDSPCTFLVCGPLLNRRKRHGGSLILVGKMYVVDTTSLPTVLPVPLKIIAGACSLCGASETVTKVSAVLTRGRVLLKALLMSCWSPRAWD